MLRGLLLLSVILLSGCASGLYNTGDYDKSLKFNAEIEDEATLVLFSTRSQSQTTNNIYFYFIKEGAKAGDKSQMIQIMRPAGVPLIGTYATTREYQLTKAQPGKYKLYAHTIGYFPNIHPYASVSHGVGVWAGKIYADGGISFEVKPNQVTYIGDIWLEMADFPENSPIKGYDRLVVKLGRERLVEAEEYLGKYTSIDRELVYNSSVSSDFRSLVTCDHIQKKLFTPRNCPPQETTDE